MGPEPQRIAGRYLMHERIGVSARSCLPTSPDGERLVVADRPIHVLAGGYGGRPAVCLVQIPHREFTSSNGAARVEVVQIVLTGDGSPDKPCRTTTDPAAPTPRVSGTGRADP